VLKVQYSSFSFSVSLFSHFSLFLLFYFSVRGCFFLSINVTHISTFCLQELSVEILVVAPTHLAVRIYGYRDFKYCISKAFSLSIF